MIETDGFLVLLVLLLGHLIGDFSLQPNKWVKDKANNKGRSLYLYLHASVHVFITALILGVTTDNSLSVAVTMACIVGAAHGVIDYIKVTLGNSGKWFVIDQLLHVFVLVLLWFYLYHTAFEQVKDLLTAVHYERLVLFVVAYVIMLKPAAILVGVILAKWSAEIDSMSDSHVGLSNAGQYLGYIERVLVLTFVLNSQFAAIGFVLAAKSIFRMGDLREAHDRKFTEYVMLGTLFSMSLAVFIGLGVRWLLA